MYRKEESPRKAREKVPLALLSRQRNRIRIALINLAWISISKWLSCFFRSDDNIGFVISFIFLVEMLLFHLNRYYIAMIVFVLTAAVVKHAAAVWQIFEWQKLMLNHFSAVEWAREIVTSGSIISRFNFRIMCPSIVQAESIINASGQLNVINGFDDFSSRRLLVPPPPTATNKWKQFSIL